MHLNWINFVTVLSVKKMNFHHMGHTNFPSTAAVASKDWSNYSDHLEIPSLVKDLNSFSTVCINELDKFNLIRWFNFRNTTASKVVKSDPKIIISLLLLSLSLSPRRTIFYSSTLQHSSLSWFSRFLWSTCSEDGESPK